MNNYLVSMTYQNQPLQFNQTPFQPPSPLFSTHMDDVDGITPDPYSKPHERIRWINYHTKDSVHSSALLPPVPEYHGKAGHPVTIVKTLDDVAPNSPRPTGDLFPPTRVPSPEPRSGTWDGSEKSSDSDSTIPSGEHRQYALYPIASGSNRSSERRKPREKKRVSLFNPLPSGITLTDREQKCERCRANGYVCNGVYPVCNHCRKDMFFCIWPQDERRLYQKVWAAVKRSMKMGNENRGGH